MVKGQELLKPDQWHFAKLDFNDKEKQMFHEAFQYHKSGKITKRYVFNEPWRFVFRVRPHMITTVRIKDGDLEARIDEIDDYLGKDDVRGRLLKLQYGNDRWRYWKQVEYVNPFKNWPLEKIIDHSKEEIYGTETKMA